MDFQSLVKERYSCKKYSDKPVEQAVLDQILETARWAPTAKNLQEQHIYVLKSADALAKLDKVTPCRYGAPMVIMVAFDATNVFTYPGGGRDSGIEDAAIVATHLMLAAKACGVDSCWLNKFDPAQAKAEFNLPDNEEVLMLLDLGYPAEGAAPLPNHASRKELTETVSYL